jgi:putative SOS response-associated peptidase YedK
MCGRFALTSSAPRLARLLGLYGPTEVAPRYNIAPTQSIPAVRETGSGTREWVNLHWGLIPPWAKETRGAYRMINARAESLAQRPAFRSAFRRRRCLIPASGFYEWRQGPGRKQPWYVTRRDEEPFAFAGLWERWRGPDAQVVESCTVITTEANPLVKTIHDRMPVILDPEDFAPWLSLGQQDTTVLAGLLRGWPEQPFRAFPVSTRVNDARIDDAACVEPLATDVTEDPSRRR